MQQPRFSLQNYNTSDIAHIVQFLPFLHNAALLHV